jgi:hypothetical protein
MEQKLGKYQRMLTPSLVVTNNEGPRILPSYSSFSIYHIFPSKTLAISQNIHYTIFI